MDHEERDVLAAFDGAIESRAQEDEWICAVIDARSLSFAQLRSGTPPA
jgi:hypothetical protein